MFKFSVSKEMKNMDIIREMAIGKVATHLCLTLIINKLKISIEHGRVVTTLNIIFYVVVDEQAEFEKSPVEVH